MIFRKTKTRDYALEAPDRQRIWRASGWIASGVLFAVAFATTEPDAANAATPPRGVSATQARDSSGPLVTYDDLLVDVNKRLPGFGGMFFDESGNLSVYLTQMAEEGSPEYGLQASQARGAIVEVFGEQLLEANRQTDRATKERPATEPVQVALLGGEYEVRNLNAWKRAANEIPDFPGVLFTDMDEMVNRVVIGIEESTSRAEVWASLERTGVELDAFELVIDTPTRPTQSLTDDIEPNMGGIQIRRTGGGCTFGFVASVNDKEYFVTASHCTWIQGGGEGTEFYQPSSPNDLGIELLDPSYFDNVQFPWSACPTGRLCRYSDSALVDFLPGMSSALGEIARPSSWNQGDLTINSGNPVLNIVAEHSWPTAGQYFDKVGRTTGWTYGRVDRTCYDTNQKDTIFTMICQYKVARTYGGHVMAASGDSGAPVFYYRGNTVDLAGINWGSTEDSFVFSALPAVEWELGPLTTF